MKSLYEVRKDFLKNSKVVKEYAGSYPYKRFIDDLEKNKEVYSCTYPGAILKYESILNDDWFALCQIFEILGARQPEWININNLKNVHVKFLKSTVEAGRVELILLDEDDEELEDEVFSVPDEVFTTIWGIFCACGCYTQIVILKGYRNLEDVVKHVPLNADIYAVDDLSIKINMNITSSSISIYETEFNAEDEGWDSVFVQKGK